MYINLAFFSALLISILFLSTALVGAVWFFTGFNRASQKTEKKAPTKKIIRLDEKKLEEFMTAKMVKLTNQYLKKAEKVFQTVFASYPAEANKQVAGFSANLGKLTVGLEETVRQKVEESYQKMATEVEKEKEKRLKELDNDIVLLVQKVTEEVLGKSLTTEEQERLVLEALEKAKKKLW